MNHKAAVLKAFQTIPSVGKQVAKDLWDLGYRSLDELAHQNPEKMYEDLCVLQQTNVDRCMLYTFRCIVYYCSHDAHEAKLLKWWNWKD